MSSSNELRNKFLDFFKNKDHTIVESAPVFPQNDPTLLFTNAGMNQFKDVFLNTGTRSYKRAADTQKCIRVSGKHNDLEEVGVDTYHHTFFEMLGNWSFGDYFKKEAIEWAWEFLTKELNLPSDTLYATVFGGNEKLGLSKDLETFEIWKNNTDIDESHIEFHGAKDNFWEMGATGPCGPCTEIHVDRGPDACDKKNEEGHVCKVNGDCARYIEIWNLVFMQYNKLPNGTLEPLPAKHVDTGMGLERLTALTSGVLSNYDTDLFVPLFEKLEKLTGIKYKTDHKTDVAFRVIADHIKALTIAVSDGATPGNTGRGYVLRRLLRRAVRYAWQTLGIKEPFAWNLVDTVTEIYSEVFPELKKRSQYVKDVIKSEEVAFMRTIDKGIVLFEDLVKSMHGNVIDGYKAFDLYSTYGFPKDLIELMARERNLSLDEDGWSKAMKLHEKASEGKRKNIADFDLSELENLPPTEFIGYLHSHTNPDNAFSTKAKLLKLIKNNSIAILDKTPFYAESGGQIGDTGSITGENFEFEVTDTKKFGDFILHYGKIIRSDGNYPVSVQAEVNKKRRWNIMANHTATHLLHYALGEVLGDHALQQGSSVEPEKLRFDFTHHKKLTKEEIERIENLVNEAVYANYPVKTDVMDIKEAKKSGAKAIFGEKYGEKVRVVKIDPVSREFCGGTHLTATGHIGLFTILEETSLSAGVRRIVAITRGEAIRYMQQQRSSVQTVSSLLSSPPNEFENKITALKKQISELKKASKKSSGKDLNKFAVEILQNSEKIDETSIVVRHLDNLDRKQMSELSDLIKSKSKSVAGVLTAVDSKGGVVILTFTDKNLQKVHAGNLLREIAPIVDGKGGGRPDFAQGGGKNKENIKKLLEKAKELIKTSLSK